MSIEGDTSSGDKRTDQQELELDWLAEAAKKMTPHPMEARAQLKHSCRSSQDITGGSVGPTNEWQKWASLPIIRILEEKRYPLYWSGCLLLCRDVPALEGSITGSSTVMGISKPIGCSGEGSTEGNAEGDLLMGMGNCWSEGIIIGKPSEQSKMGWGGSQLGLVMGPAVASGGDSVIPWAQSKYNWRITAVGAPGGRLSLSAF
jgi:hypothetical protein